MRFLQSFVIATILLPIPCTAQRPAQPNHPPATTQAPVPPSSEQPISSPSLLDQARARAVTYFNDLPDFTVTQITRRSILFRGEWNPVDVLEKNISFEHNSGETIRLVSIDGLPVDQSYQAVRGSKEIGVFSSQLTTPFLPSSKATFGEDGDELYRGRPCRIYRYAVPKLSSGYELRAALNGTPPKATIVGYNGRMWIDRETGYPLRIEKFAFEIPPDFPISGAEVVVEYDWITISGNRFWLPIKAESLVDFVEHSQVFLNVSEFRDYRKFDSEVKVVD